MKIKANRPITISGRVFLTGEEIPEGLASEEQVRKWLGDRDVSEIAGQSVNADDKAADQPEDAKEEIAPVQDETKPKKKPKR